MATYIIGDIQGCWQSLQELLKRIRFSADQDMLWLTGDLVNRGPQSLEVLRWATQNARFVRVVLGNHDLKLLACSLGVGSTRSSRSLDAVLEAPDRDTLTEWLLAQPLLFREANRGVMIHAGLRPDWSLAQAETIAQATHEILASHPREVLEAYFQDKGTLPPDHPAQALAAFTLTRMVNPAGVPDFEYSGTLEEAPPGYTPWFAHRPAGEPRLFFGHWAALGFRESASAVCLDSGCVWGESLTAYRLEDGSVFQAPGLSGGV